MNGIIILIILGVLAGLVIMAVWVASRRYKLSPEIKKSVQDKWQEINKIGDDKLKIIEADKLLDYLLTAKRYTGSLGDKLKAASRSFRNRKAVRSAHHVRNQIAHEVNFQLSAKEAREVLHAYEGGISDLLK